MRRFGLIVYRAGPESMGLLRRRSSFPGAAAVYSALASSKVKSGLILRAWASNWAFSPSLVDFAYCCRIFRSFTLRDRRRAISRWRSTRPIACAALYFQVHSEWPLPADLPNWRKSYLVAVPPGAVNCGQRSQTCFPDAFPLRRVIPGDPVPRNVTCKEKVMTGRRCFPQRWRQSPCICRESRRPDSCGHVPGGFPTDHVAAALE